MDKLKLHLFVIVASIPKLKDKNYINSLIMAEYNSEYDNGVTLPHNKDIEYLINKVSKLNIITLLTIAFISDLIEKLVTSFSHVSMASLLSRLPNILVTSFVSCIFTVLGIMITALLVHISSIKILKRHSGYVRVLNVWSRLYVYVMIASLFGCIPIIGTWAYFIGTLISIYLLYTLVVLLKEKLPVIQ